MPKLLPALLLLLALLAPARAGAEPPVRTPPLRVFIVHSYHQDFVWTRLVNQGVAAALKGLNVTTQMDYMDAKRSPGPESLHQAAAEARKRIEAFRPQVVIAVDDAAQQYLVVPHLRDRPGPQVVFCGLNAPPSSYGYPASNVSGVRERWHFRDGFALLRQLAPKTRSVAFLVEDTETGRSAAADLLAEQRQGGPYALQLAGVEKVQSFQQWQRLVRQYQTRADALALPLYHSLIDEDTGQVVSPEQVMDWTHSVNTLPTLGLLDYAREHGLLCGVLESGQEQGYLAGSMAREVLTRGVKAGSLPLRVNKRGVVLVNLKTAQRLGLVVPFGLIESAGVVVR